MGIKATFWQRVEVDLWVFSLELLIINLNI
jgi:hypothetical protein